VVDEAGILPADAEDVIVRILERLETETGVQMAVLTVPSLERESLEEFTIRVVETWQLGQEDRDDGILLFVAQQDRRLRLEVGYGLEGQVTDAMSGRILDRVVAPAFRQGEFARGIEEAVDAVTTLVGGGEPPAVLTRERDTGPGIGGCIQALLLLFFVVVFFILPNVLRLRRLGGWSSRRGWSTPWIIGSGLGGGRSGGFGGFSGGGGGFGGGGASGGW